MVDPSPERAAAREKGLKRYRTGVPCARGHIGDRLVSNCACLACADQRRKERHAAKPHLINDKARRRRQENPELAREYTRRWVRNNPERARESARFSTIKRLYRLTAEEYRSLLASQNGKCAVCSVDVTALPTKQIHVDHDHRTGAVRSILCYRCNLALGFVKESVVVVRALLAYVQSFVGEGEDNG